MAFDWSGLLSNLIYLGLFFVFIFFYPRIMISQMMFSLERTVNTLEKWTNEGKNIVIKKITKKPSKELREAVNNFLEFFRIEPVNIDPYGVMKKIEHLDVLSDERLKYFAKNIAPKFDTEAQADIVGGLSGAITLHQIAKIVRHYVEMIRKTKNLQLALVLQMQLPMIEKLSRAMLYATEALSNGWPIGDSVGPLVVAHLIGDSHVKEFDDETLYVQKNLFGKQVIIVKAKGPGGRLGKLGRVVEKLSKGKKIAKIITIDAALKLEGEKTGSVAEGIGVAIGGSGVDRSYIENVSTQSRIPIDAVAIKMSQEEAVMPMKNEIFNSVNHAMKVVEENLKRTRGHGKIIIVGVGNCSGIGNNKKAAMQVETLIRKNAQTVKKKEEEEEREQKKWKLFGF